MRSIDKDGDRSVDIDEFFMHFGHQRSDVLAISAMAGAADLEGGGSAQDSTPPLSQSIVGPFASPESLRLTIVETDEEPISAIGSSACCGKLG
jgi:hypothetical protein